MTTRAYFDRHAKDGRALLSPKPASWDRLGWVHGPRKDYQTRWLMEAYGRLVLCEDDSYPVLRIVRDTAQVRTLIRRPGTRARLLHVRRQRRYRARQKEQQAQYLTHRGSGLLKAPRVFGRGSRSKQLLTRIMDAGIPVAQ